MNPANRGDDTERLLRLAPEAGLPDPGIEQLAGDVGRRRYFRLSAAGATAIGVVYPAAELEARSRWLAVRDLLAPRIRVPRVLADDGESVQILEDFGTAALSDVWLKADTSRRRSLLTGAAEIAAAIASADDPGVNPPFSADFFERELHRSKEAVFGRYFREPLSSEEERIHDSFAASISREIAAHPRTLVHRDFHGDNLLVLGDGTLGTIDFQDARLGPDSYDLASLCRERATLLAPDPEAELAAQASFAGSARTAEGLPERVARVRLQRAWKACGTFAAAAAEGRARPYAKFLRKTLDLVAELLTAGGPEAEFRAILERRSVKLSVEGE